MISKPIRDALRAEPFRPFALKTSAGDRYEVRSPDQAWLRPARLFIAVDPQADAEEDLVVQVALLHVTAIEEVHAA